MYKFKEKMLPKAIENMILEATKRHDRQTRFQLNETNKKILIPNSSLKHHNILYKMLDYWNQSCIEIKSSTYKLGTVKKRIDHYLRLKHDHFCDKIGCYSCYRFDEEKILKYMKFQGNTPLYSPTLSLNTTLLTYPGQVETNVGTPGKFRTASSVHPLVAHQIK